MRVAVTSDVHANLPALEAVLADIDAHAPDEIWFLGDVTGRGGSPRRCVELIRRRASVALAGNHDLAVDGRLGYFFGFTADSSDPIICSQRRHRELLDGQLSWLRSLEPSGERHGIQMWHASPRDPVWEFVNARPAAESNLRVQRADLGLFGHTHQPTVITSRSGAAQLNVPEHDETVSLHGKMMLNPGSVTGPQHDGDRRAAWMLLDIDQGEAVFRRVAYDVDAAVRDVLDLGLPRQFAEKLYGRG